MEKKQFNILVIEDNEGDFLLVEEFLYEKFEEVNLNHAKNSRQAIDVLSAKSVPFDVILLDLSLPDRTGISLIYQVISVCADVPVIVLTGYDDFDFGIKSLSLGVSDYLLKDELTSLTLYKSIVYSSERKKITSALEASEKRARNYAKQLNDALEDERLRIAREIHDDLGQQFSGLKMSLSALKRLNGSKSEMEEIIDSMIGDVNTSIHSLRQIANELRPVILDKLGLFAAIEWLVSGFEKKNAIECHIQITDLMITLDKVQEINVFRICQEAFTNISKHSGASEVEVLIEKRYGELVLRIADNGKGIDETNVQKSLSMGLINMQERANFIGATLNIDSTPGTGSNIILTIPLNDNKNINS
ncbi:hybrid sensor histidine kinase/response regulator [Mucilaginibacter gotjawali]|uniref:histidine kinase n=2 Tax=Mucilaginibacter gotjawali TaxID=1550579 RepID=A0A0X8X2C1_9SPHI|nr:histidine kinase [Mucilaginibacter gotjawali]MBB3054066.1 signal transduction histidine kinase [Mucilaginibacter gotjawali]BAU54335.1 Signal transduction histidine-protein kinase/phosphatase DegS [Mucilaginibacter gotjawali]